MNINLINIHQMEFNSIFVNATHNNNEEPELKRICIENHASVDELAWAVMPNIVIAHFNRIYRVNCLYSYLIFLSHLSI